MYWYLPVHDINASSVRKFIFQKWDLAELAAWGFG
jgi:hypothetical protein